MHRQMSVWGPFVVGLLLVWTNRTAIAQSIEGLSSFAPNAPTGNQLFSGSTINDLSSDGKVIIGSAETGAFGRMEPFRWSAGDGFQTIGSAFSYFASGVSGDGAVVVGTGRAISTTDSQGYYWTDTTNLVWMNVVPEEHGAAAISNDGLTIVGTVVDYRLSPAPEPAFNVTEAYRWRDGTAVGLGRLNGTTRSHAKAVSSDGEIVVGRSGLEAFRWTEADGMVGLGRPNGNGISTARDVSADGSVVVGDARGALTGPDIAFYWTSADGLTTLGTLPGGNSSTASGVSPDGTLVFGTSGYTTCTSTVCTTTDSGFVWREDLGMVELNDFVSSILNADLAGWRLTELTAISADGLTWVGSGDDPNDLSNSWRLIVPEPETHLMILVGFLMLGRLRQVIAI